MSTTEAAQSSFAIKDARSVHLGSPSTVTDARTQLRVNRSFHLCLAMAAAVQRRLPCNHPRAWPFTVPHHDTRRHHALAILRKLPVERVAVARVPSTATSLPSLPLAAAARPRRVEVQHLP